MASLVDQNQKQETDHVTELAQLRTDFLAASGSVKPLLTNSTSDRSSITLILII